MCSMVEQWFKTGKLVSCKLRTDDDVGSTPWMVGMEGRIPGLFVVEGCVFPALAEFRMFVEDIPLPAEFMLNSVCHMCVA
ncbi:hypothetical protein HOLleu_01134 [Holothuria leucospilota]|uniref:Uncharacterized protein n=1 Tax=Holothuria leucospilota TaxID=206669 RepID=A0A9Q1CPJ7_HOLLE|nr:hypothetical protein HOLleu_01134 [Holothuria leucospilota]